MIIGLMRSILSFVSLLCPYYLISKAEINWRLFLSSPFLTRCLFFLISWFIRKGTGDNARYFEPSSSWAFWERTKPSHQRAILSHRLGTMRTIRFREHRVKFSTRIDTWQEGWRRSSWRRASLLYPALVRFFCFDYAFRCGLTLVALTLCMSSGNNDIWRELVFSSYTLILITHFDSTVNLAHVSSYLLSPPPHRWLPVTQPLPDD